MTGMDVFMPRQLARKNRRQQLDQSARAAHQKKKNRTRNRIARASRRVNRK